MKKLAIFFVAAAVGYLHQEAIVRSAPRPVAQDERVIRISASTFDFNPSQITLKRGVPVVLELTSKDRHHGFKLSQFQIQVDIKPGEMERVRFVPNKTGKFTFLCDVFCGDGHEEMSGIIEVIE
jgi:cytochrome c oxidase subunit 2